MFLDSKKKEQCCGCTACSQICPVSAIKMEEDEKGFFYPVLDQSKCINCSKCRKVCPMEENYMGREAAPEIYAGKSKDENIVKESSSGGMFSALAQWVLERNGVVYGVAFDENFSVRHMRAISEREVGRFRGSKYVESDISQVYQPIIEDLKAGCVVLVTGTPCQISAVTKFLKLKHIGTDKLYTCDNICHGVPSRKVWGDYLNILKRKHIAVDDKITHIHMRSKKKSWRAKTLDIGLQSGNIDTVLEKLSFNRLYETLLITRPSCFACRYTSYKRPSDFTVGDFWNAESMKLPFDIDGGVSTLMVNTEKGERVLGELRNRLYLYPLTKQQSWQPHLEYSAKCPANQEKFWEEYNTLDREAVFRKYMKGSVLTRVIRGVTPMLRKTGLYSIAGKLYKMVFVKDKGKNE